MTLADIISQECMSYGDADILTEARKVKIHRDVFDTALALVAKTPAAKIAALSKFTCWPDYSTWLETERDDEGRRMGFLFIGHFKDGDSVTMGDGLLVMDYPDPDMRIQIPVRYNLETYDIRFHIPVSQERLRELAGMETLPADLRAQAEKVIRESWDPIKAHMTHAPLLAQVKPILFTLLALLNSPKLVRTREVDVDRLNARRLKAGKYPYHPHHEVRLNIDKHSFQITQGQGDGPERCLHFVRAHLRFLVHPRYKNVSVVLVPPHHRGNPELGIVNTSYAVGNQNSRWA